MREIDPQSEARLSEALRRLAAASPQAAPPEVGAGLLGEFRRYHARRRRIRRTAMALTLAACAGAGTWLSLFMSHSGGKRTGPPALAVQPTQAPPVTEPPQMQVSVKTPSPFRPQRTRKQDVRAGNRAFLALPGYDPAVPMEELQVVRVKLPASALWKIGAPVGADAGERPMTADFVMSQDGTPYAVRLVQ